MGADLHIDDPDDRAELAVRAFELYGQLGSLRKVREHLAADPATVRICGRVRHFSIDTIRTWIGEGRAAESYMELLSLAEQRADANTRLSLLAATAWEILRVQGAQTVAEKLAALDFMRKIERDRMDLLGLKAPIKVQQVGPDPAPMDEDGIAMIEALRRKALARQQDLIDDGYPGATVLPTQRRPRRGRRPDPPEQRTS